MHINSHLINDPILYKYNSFRGQTLYSFLYVFISLNLKLLETWWMWHLKYEIQNTSTDRWKSQTLEATLRSPKKTMYAKKATWSLVMLTTWWNCHISCLLAGPLTNWGNCWVDGWTLPGQTEVSQFFQVSSP